MGRTISRLVRLATQYEDQSEDTDIESGTDEDTTSFEIPEDFTSLDDDGLNALHEEAVGHFDTLYGDGSGLSDEDIEALAALTDGIEALNAEQSAREEKAAARAEQAAELATRVRGEHSAQDTDGETDTDGEDETDGEDDGEDTDETEGEDEDTEDDAEGASKTVTASAPPQRKGPVRVNLSGSRSRGRGHTPRTDERATGTRSVMFANDAPGVTDGTGIDFMQAAKAVDRRLQGFPVQVYESAARAGRGLREQHSLAMIRKPFGEGQVIKNSDPEHVADVLARATDERNTPQKSLVASGGWCAPSEVLYDNLLELESRDGLFSLPEVGVTRGGFSFTRGPSFRDIYDGTGFEYTEQQDIDGNYGTDDDGVGNDTEGSKPCYKVDCPPFEEVRLAVAGLCITAGLLQSRGYPEVIARTIRGALVAHDHKMAARRINAVAAGSDAVTMPAGQVGATAPVLTAIELQVEHYRYVHRISRSTTLEAVFPLWTHGAIRADLARRLGVDLISVPNARINAWFAERGVAPQFVYNWQDITGDAADFTAWPTEVEFLLYPAGAWVAGSSDIITLDTIYDSVNLGQNDYTALFTEEGWLVTRMGPESRRITVPLETNGATHAGVLINHDGTAVDAA